MIPRRLWNVIAIGVVFTCTIFFLSYHGLPNIGLSPERPAEPKKERPPGPIHKNKTASDSKVIQRPPIQDNFPIIGNLSTGSLPVPSWNKPPTTHVPEKTPLFLGFTRNWPMLQQCVISYITAGWPPEDIYVVDNTGTMKSNFDGKLTLQNPFYLNVQRLQEVFHVNVISTPTLLSFAQLQNFYIFTAMEHKWGRSNLMPTFCQLSEVLTLCRLLLVGTYGHRCDS